jgi:hypothetical protein
MGVDAQVCRRSGSCGGWLRVEMRHRQPEGEDDEETKVGAGEKKRPDAAKVAGFVHGAC